jgi:aryl-alcohol dehydrogenase-like predicted oxidoreductase
MRFAPFGKSGHNSSRVIFGAAALWQQSWGQDWANSLLDSVLEAGVNHIDTAASYGDSELLLNPWLAASNGGVSNRSHVFLATKTDQRDAIGARQQLELSLERLGVDHVDLVQLHNLVEPDEWESVHAPGGALEAMVAARDEGLVRFIGVTGHGVRIASMHQRSLEAFPYDSVLLPYNATMLSVPEYLHDVEQLLQVCADGDVAVQTIKSIARRRWPAAAERDVEETRSWYQPLRDPSAIERALRFVLANDQLFLNTSSDARLLEGLLAAANQVLSHDIVRPPDHDSLHHDVETYSMAPLFDGADLERI